MKNDSDIGDNTAALMMVGGSLFFTGWLIKQMINLVLPPVPPIIAVVATERTQTRFFESDRLRVEQQTTEVVHRA